MESVLSGMFGVVLAFACFSAWQWYAWRNIAQSVLQGGTPQQQASTREEESKREYERLLNALEDERRAQHEAMLEAFDFLNDNSPFGSHQEGLMQVRNMLMRTIQTSTYGRE